MSQIIFTKFLHKNVTNAKILLNYVILFLLITHGIKSIYVTLYLTQFVKLYLRLIFD